MRAAIRFGAWAVIASTQLLAVPMTAHAAAAPSRAADGESPRPVTLHDIHLTYSRVLIDGGSILWRVRLFRDDLEKALRAYARAPDFTTTAPGADSVFGAYFNAEVPVVINGTRVTAKVVQSGRDVDATDQAMWWYLLELSAVPPVRTLTVRVGLLFQYFADQRNIVTVLKTPGQDRRSMYFVGDDQKGQTLQF